MPASDVWILTLSCGEVIIKSGQTYGFHGAEGDVGNELGAGGGNGEANGLVLDGVFGAGGGAEDILEHLVEAELAHALSTVSGQGGEPALKGALDLIQRYTFLQPPSHSSSQRATGEVVVVRRGLK